MQTCNGASKIPGNSLVFRYCRAEDVPKKRCSLKCVLTARGINTLRWRFRKFIAQFSIICLKNRRESGDANEPGPRIIRLKIPFFIDSEHGFAQTVPGLLRFFANSATKISRPWDGRERSNQSKPQKTDCEFISFITCFCVTQFCSDVYD